MRREKMANIEYEVQVEKLSVDILQEIALGF